MKKPIAIAALFTVLAGGVGAHPARAQIDPQRQSFGVYENEVLVGEVFREGADTSNYVEHWVLSPRYVYPSDDHRVAVILRPSGRAYDDARDFVANTPWETGSRYVRAECADNLTLPRLRLQGDIAPTR